MARAGFTGKRGATLAVPAAAESLTIAVGVGAGDDVDATVVRTAAAGFAVALFVVWYLIGLPRGPGYPVTL